MDYHSIHANKDALKEAFPQSEKAVPKADQRKTKALRYYAALVGIYGSINVKIVLQYYAGTRSLYIQEGRQDKGRKSAPRDGAQGLSYVRTPPPVRHVRMPSPVCHLQTPTLVRHLWTPTLVCHLRTPIILTLLIAQIPL